VVSFYYSSFPRLIDDFCRQQIFTLIASAACVTNAALSVFTMDVLDNKSIWFRMWFFILFQWVCFTLQSITMALVPDEPPEAAIQRSRRCVVIHLIFFFFNLNVNRMNMYRDFINEKIIMKIPDEVFGTVMSEDTLDERAPFVIHEYSTTGSNKGTFSPTADILIPADEGGKKKKKDK
jgi:hypothetical protein